MRKATRILAAAFGVAAGVAGMGHGIYEMFQGNIRPESLVIASIGPPCDPETAWNACEPALTILPNFFVTGLMATLIGLVIVVWSVDFIQRRHGGLVLVLLSVVLLLFGGGFFPPLIGLVGGLAGTQINRAATTRKGAAFHFLAALWPWPLVIFLVWIFGQIIVGYFFNDFLQSVMVFSVLLILVTMLLSVLTAYAADAVVAPTGKEHIAL